MRRKVLSQGALALIAWLLFAYYWWLVSRRRLNPATISALTILFSSVGVVCLLTLFWIRHNKRLARRAKGRRKDRRRTPLDGDRDVLGRLIEEAGSEPLFLARYVEIDLSEDGEIKRYHKQTPPAREESS